MGEDNLLGDDKTELRGDIERTPSQADDQPAAQGASPKIDTDPVVEASKDRDVFVSLHVPGYTTLNLIGAGGFGTVYRARDARGRDVAIKMLNRGLARSKEIVQRFRHAADAVKRLNHPNIVRVLDIVEADDRPGLVMEFIHGEDLAQVLQKRGKLPADEVVSIAAQMCAALAYAHAQGIIHRDVKPANILLVDNGDGVKQSPVAKLTDFDIAKIITEEEVTRTGLQMGTPYYVAPEQWRGSHDVDGRADIFSLGVVMYQMLTGEVPTGRFEHPSDTTPGIPRRLGSVVLKALAWNRDIRYQDMAELKEALIGDEATKVEQNIPFEFQSGQPARSLFELVDRCDNDWQTGLRHLREGDILIWLERVYPDRVPGVRSVMTAKKNDNDDEVLEEVLHCLDPTLPWPVLETEPFFLDLGELAPGEWKKGTITIHNPSRGYLSGQVIGTPEWAVVKPKDFHCRAGKSQAVDIEVQVPEAAPFRPMDGELQLESNGGNASVSVSLTVGRRLLLWPNYSVGSVNELCSAARQDWNQIRTLLYNGKLIDWLRQGILRFGLANAAKDIVSQEEDRDVGLFRFLKESCARPEDCLPPKLVTRPSSIDLGKGGGRLGPVRVKVQNSGGGDLRGLKIVNPPNWVAVKIVNADKRHAMIELAGDRRKADRGVSRGVVKLALPDSPVPRWGNVEIEVRMEVPFLAHLFELGFLRWLLLACLLVVIAGVITAHFIGWQWVLLAVVAVIASVATVFYLFS